MYALATEEEIYTTICYWKVLIKRVHILMLLLWSIYGQELTQTLCYNAISNVLYKVRSHKKHPCLAVIQVSDIGPTW